MVGRQIIALRFFVVALAVVVSLVAEAQPTGKLPRIGVISEFSPAHPFVAAFQQGLRDLGYTAQTTTVPIVFATAGDPVSSGLVASLAHPGGNVTGISILSPELSGKQLELLKAVAPKASRVTVLYNPVNPAAGDALNATREAARALSLELQLLEVRQPNELPGAFSALTGWRAGALLVLPDPMFGNVLDQISKLSAKHRLPAMYVRREFAETGGLLAYGPSFLDNYRRAAIYVDKLLKGATPADLPIQQPTKFELVINLRTAKAFGLTVPQSLILQADKVIE